MPRSIADTRVEPDGQHWGQYTATTKLPGTALGVVAPRLTVGDVAVVSGLLYVCVSTAPAAAVWKQVLHLDSSNAVTVSALTIAGTTTVDGDLSSTGNIDGTFIGTVVSSTDLAASGGFRQTVGPFTAPGAAGVTAASQTNLDCRYSHTVTAAALSYVAMRAGSIMGISGQLSAAITGASTTITISATVNGTEVAATAQFTQAGAETTKFAVVAKDTLAFAAGDILGISYTSTGITNTPALVAALEIEQ
jgi:hypothetical protein